ncbi:MAG: hypothetical protein AB3N14_16150 [Flavobacteriaceae bacterium]
MKRNPFIGLVIFLCLCGSMTSVVAQETKEANKKEIKVKKKTVMEQYEPEMILTVDDRIKLKKDRLALIKKRRSIIDTLDISDRRKRRLLKELYRTPHSYKWEKLIADIEFEEEEEY